jgi:hypothetical protein
MEKLIRRTFALTKRQMAYLTEMGDKLGISIADAYRRILDDHIDKK